MLVCNDILSMYKKPVPKVYHNVVCGLKNDLPAVVARGSFCLFSDGRYRSRGGASLLILLSSTLPLEDGTVDNKFNVLRLVVGIRLVANCNESGIFYPSVFQLQCSYSL